MSGSELKSSPPVEEKRPRRTVSVYDKMEEARARRAAILHASDPANLPTAVPPPEDRPEIVPPQPDPAPIPARDPLADAPVRDIAEPAKAKTATSLARALTVLLVALVATAVFTFDRQEITSSPEFNPPLVTRPATGSGVPLLISLSETDDHSLASLTPSRLQPVLSDLPPVVENGPVNPSAPKISTLPESDATPSSDVLTAIRGIRPLPRPDAGSSLNATN